MWVSSLLPLPGPSLSCFHWPRGVQACARLQQFLEWARSAGLGVPAERFFRKLSCTLHLLATPSAQLVQVRGTRDKCKEGMHCDSRVTGLQTKLRWPGLCTRKTHIFPRYLVKLLSSPTVPTHTRLDNPIGVYGKSLRSVWKGHSAGVTKMKALRRRTWSVAPTGPSIVRQIHRVGQRVGRKERAQLIVLLSRAWEFGSQPRNSLIPAPMRN